MMLVPDSYGTELLEFNPCHSKQDGKFCSTLKGELARAEKLGVQFDVTDDLNLRQSSYAGAGRHLVLGTGGTQDVRWPGGVNKGYDWGGGKSGVLSVARHEMGHVTDPLYGVDTTKRAQQTIGGQKFGSEYTHEFGAWRAAVRDAPHHRLNWRIVRKSLTNYLHNDAQHYLNVVKPRVERISPRAVDEPKWEAAMDREYEQLLDQHVDILRRYGRRLRAAS